MLPASSDSISSALMTKCPTWYVGGYAYPFFEALDEGKREKDGVLAACGNTALFLSFSAHLSVKTEKIVGEGGGSSLTWVESVS